MLISLSWLREFVPYEGDVQNLGDRLTMLGLELEGIHDPFAEIAQVVVGHVTECARHPCPAGCRSRRRSSAACPPWA